jgi:thioredoxin-like negative regulator of GroEL
MSGEVREIGEADFAAQVEGSTTPVVVDFFSTECAPCEALAPVYERVAGEFGGKAAFVKIFRQGNRALSERLGVKGSPTLLFYRDGKEAAPRLAGEIKRSQIKAAVQALLGDPLAEVRP